MIGGGTFETLRNVQKFDFSNNECLKNLSGNETLTELEKNSNENCKPSDEVKNKWRDADYFEMKKLRLKFLELKNRITKLEENMKPGDLDKKNELAENQPPENNEDGLVENQPPENNEVPNTTRD
jgi:hypothetical protein